MTDLDPLFELVYRYSQFGFHRTGTLSDVQTQAWLAELLRGQGAEISMPSFDYPHYAYDLQLEPAAEVADVVPLFFSFQGQITVTNPLIAEVDGHAAEPGLFAQIDHLVEAGLAAGHDGVILQTGTNEAGVCAINRSRETACKLPVFLASPQRLRQFRTAAASISFAAETRRARATNIVARFPVREGAPTLVVTTPVSGWFNCAGERGAGLAVALHSAVHLSRQVNVELLLASGHELGFRGGYALAEDYSGAATSVLHLGSCIANFEASFDVNCSAPPPVRDGVDRALSPLGLKSELPHPVHAPEAWSGESSCWAPKGLRMLSIAGLAPNFHTPADLPAAVTDENLLQRTTDAIVQAAQTLYTG